MSNPVSTSVDLKVIQSQRPSVNRHILTATVTSKKIKWAIDGDVADGADETDDDDRAADDNDVSLFVRVVLTATPFTKLQSSLDEGGQQMTTQRPDDTVDSLENDEDSRSTKEDDDEIVIRLSGFARTQNSTPPKVANGVLKQSIEGTTDERPNQSKVTLEPMHDQSTQTTRPLTDLLLTALTMNTTTPSDYINATMTQMERDNCNHSIETKFCTIF